MNLKNELLFIIVTGSITKFLCVKITSLTLFTISKTNDESSQLQCSFNLIIYLLKLTYKLYALRSSPFKTFFIFSIWRDKDIVFFKKKT